MGNKLSTRLLLPAALAATVGCAPSSRVHVQAAMPPVANSPSLEQGIALLRNGNVSMAIETLQIAARREPNPRRALNALGVAYDRLGRFDLSRSYYEQALALAPADADILHNLSVSLRMQGRLAEAEEVAQEEQSRRAAAIEQHADAAPAPAMAPSAMRAPPAAMDHAAIAPEARVAPLPPRPAITPPANVQRAPVLGLRVVNCVGRRGMARRIASAIAARGFGGAELVDETRQFERTVLILPQAAPGRFFEVLRSLNLRPAVIRYRNVKFATLMLGADAVALDQRLVRARRT